MTKYLFFFISFIATTLSCKQSKLTSNKLVRRTVDHFSIETDRIDSATYEKLIKLLSSKSSSAVHDSIFIHYLFKGDDCWSFWNKVSDEEVTSKVRTINNDMEDRLSNRPGASVFQFREPDSHANKWIRLNDKIQIDSSGWLFENIIKTKSSCGTSAAIFPDRKVLRLTTDPHLYLFYTTKEEWEKFIVAPK